MAESTNPFAGLITPSSLAAQRDAEFIEQYKGADPWVRMAADAGRDVGNRSRAMGIGLTPEDKKAALNEKVLSGAQTRYAQLVKDGKMTADEAQQAILSEAISQFAANGAWEEALTLTQPLNTLAKQAEERRKLKAEADYQESRPVTEAYKAQSGRMTAEANITRAEAAVASAKSLGELRSAQIDLAQARADHARAQTEGEYIEQANPGAKKGKNDSVFVLKERVKSDEAVQGAAAAAMLFSQALDLGMQDPGALTFAGPLATQLSAVAEGTKAAMAGRNYSITTTREGSVLAGLIARNVKDAKLHALTTDLAFAFARIRDPGGRLSNQDVENAVKIVTGEGSPQARIAVLRQAFKGMDVNIRNYKKSRDASDIGPNDVAWSTYEEAFKGYKDVEAKYRRPAAGKAPAKGAAAGPPPGLTPEQFKAWSAQNPDWKF